MAATGEVELMEERILLGHNRPLQPPDTKYTDPETGEVRYAAVLQCTCGYGLWTREGIRDHWQRGCFDVPVYATKEEVLAARVKEMNAKS